MYTSPGRVAGFIVPLALLVGCNHGQPTDNPFLANRPDAEAAEATDADWAARSPAELGDDLANAFRGTADSLRQAAARTASTATEEGRKVGTQAVASATRLAYDANQTAQMQALNQVSDWPLEQAGPVLMVVIAEGSPEARRAAADQLAKRWPPAARFPVDAAASDRQAAIAGLKNLWAEQYNQGVATVAYVQDQAQAVVDDTKQLVSDAKTVAAAAGQRVEQVRQAAAALQQADLPAVAKQEAALALERFAADADSAVRQRAAEAMGELGDPAYLPVLVAMLNDQPDVQVRAVVSLQRVAGDDAPPGIENSPPDEQVRQWQIWYRDKQGATAQP